MAQPTIPRGTRDFGPATMAKRQFIFNTIRSVFQKFGFQPLETPAMENLSTLTGKYGDEGDQLLFKILDSGEYFEKFIIHLKNSEDIKTAKNFITDILKKFSYEYIQNNREKTLTEFINDNEIEKQLESFILEESRLINDFFSIDSASPVKRLIIEFLKEQIRAISYALNSFYFNSDMWSSNKWFDDPNKNTEELKFKIDNYFPNLEDNFLNPILEKYQLSLLSSKEFTLKSSEKGLRYDLTVPFARYVVMNRGEITFPFKRYQIQPVWRADRPQKGRYREFYQCDADVVGTDSFICETEIILMIREVFSLLGITDYKIKINHRAILSGIAELVGAKENETSLFVAIDKLDKIGEEKVREELRSKGFKDTDLKVLFDILNFSGSTFQKIEFLTAVFNTPTGKKGVADLNAVLTLLWNYGADDKHLELDIALARGLSYYTGCIFEVKVNNVAIGSVSGGGRYDNLTQAFGDKENLPGIGISFGVDRLYDVMEELKLFPKDAQVSSKVFICHFDEQSMKYGLGLLTKLRRASIAAEIYPDQSKIKKQLDYVNKKMIPYSLVIGSDEVKSGVLTLKNMETGIQEKLIIEQIIEKLHG